MPKKKAQVPLSSSQVADYFLVIADEDDLVSNLKLQKLCYYAQGFCLAETGNPLFSERIERWREGPVVRDLYHSFKRYHDQPIPRPVSIDPRQFSETALELMDRVYAKFGQFDAWALREMTHREAPWSTSEIPGQIPRAQIKKFFRTQELPPDNEKLRHRRRMFRNPKLVQMTIQGFEELDGLGMGAVSDG